MRKITPKEAKQIKTWVSQLTFTKKERIRLVMICIRHYIDNVHLFRKNHKPMSEIKSFGRSFKITDEEIKEVSKMTIGEIIELFQKGK